MSQPALFPKVTAAVPYNLSECSLVYTPPDIILKLYQIMKDVHDLLIHFNIPYFIEGGSLLGAVRSGGIIPFDDDLDIQIFDADRARVKELETPLRELGYMLVPTWFGYKVCPLNGRLINVVYAWRYPALDIFFVQYTRQDMCDSDSGMYTFVDQVVRDEYGTKFCYKTDELFPLKEYIFGSLKVQGPNHPLPYLDRTYGNNWNTHCYQEWDHQTHTEMRKVIIPLTSSMREPAKPFGPLLDNVEAWLQQNRKGPQDTTLWQRP
jgi:lipopolysaccharide cholinephosphotransferase